MLVNDDVPACGEATKAGYWLVTTVPSRVLHGTPRQSVTTTDTATGPPPFGSSCQVMVTFGGLSQVPQTATLIIDQHETSTAVVLTVSRDVTLTDYLGIPASCGGAFAVLCLFLSVVFVRRNDRKNKRSFGRVRDWLHRPIVGSGAWTANDSWATNISTGLVVITAVLGATTAVSSLIPGVALDRFSIVNIAAGFFVAAAPVVFGILYSWFTAGNTGLPADATVALPGLRAASISVPSGASITMAGDTTVRDVSGHWATVRAGGTYQLPPGAEIQVQVGVAKIVRACVRAAEREVALVLARAIAHASVVAAAQAPAGTRARAVEAAVEQAVTRAGVYAPAGSLASEFELVIDDAVNAAADRPIATFVEFIGQAGVIDGAITLDKADLAAAVRTGMRAAMTDAAEESARAAAVGVPASIEALGTAIQRAVAQAVTQRDVLGAGQPADAIVGPVEDAVATEDVRKAADKAIKEAADAPGDTVPSATGAGGMAAIRAEGMAAIGPALKDAATGKVGALAPAAAAALSATVAYSGSADIGVLPGSSIWVSGPAGTWTIQASDVLTQPPAPEKPLEPPAQRLKDAQLVQLVPSAPDAPDAPITPPALIDVPGGAKVTVTGGADISLPEGAWVSAPRQRSYELPRLRQILAPQGTNLIVANLKIILIVNFFTMFGLGAELGIAGVLTAFSDATGHGRGAIFIALAAVAFLVLGYAVTATRAMADPRPGSSISAQAGSSFTL